MTSPGDEPIQLRTTGRNKAERSVGAARSRPLSPAEMEPRCRQSSENNDARRCERQSVLFSFAFQGKKTKRPGRVMRMRLSPAAQAHSKLYESMVYKCSS